MTTTRWAPFLWLTFLCSCSATAGPAAKAAFAEPRWHAGPNNACAANSVSASRAPDNSALSVLLSQQFLSLGNGGATHGHSRCVFDVLFTEPLQSGQTLLVNVRGALVKTAGSTVDYTLTFGSQRHTFSYSAGSVIDGTEPTATGVYLVNLPRGMRRLRIIVDGAGRAQDSRNDALLSIDSFDFAFAAFGAVTVPPPATAGPQGAASGPKN